jgi:hypothetical protein
MIVKALIKRKMKKIKLISLGKRRWDMMVYSIYFVNKLKLLAKKIVYNRVVSPEQM